MAPLPPTASSSSSKPSARALRQARVDGTIHPLLPSKLFRPDAAVSDSFLSTKRDRRTIRRSVFVSRVADSSAHSRTRTSSSSGRVSRRKSQKSREAKSRLGNLSALASALDDLQDDDGGGGDADDDQGRDAGEAARAGRIRHRSMKMTKGALKRKERIVRGEMHRFGVSMAKLAETTGPAAAADASSTAVTGSSATVSGVKDSGKLKGKAGDVAVAEGAKEPQQHHPSDTGNRWAALRGYISSTMEQNPAFRK
ncbi:hypothetical protein JDV02_003325 [Purpureocillium takamizusanense]|uniref:Ribosome biogenesis protein SLX9 n=1 Tax=Purpureocillium takamizusanense TaxID=2060973 RepID=A0A9Q8QBD1_9HYPO|nr:uncharacterized protein JDV02_003325 [Purpureocillium takamizusanense]UNI16943.1 hypothetical protein JDV02_003325 [Purpureocillium takamizusanense]